MAAARSTRVDPGGRRRWYLRSEVGEDWWRRTETGDLLRDLFFGHTRPKSEEVARRLGFDPLDTGPFEQELTQ